MAAKKRTTTKTKKPNTDGSYKKVARVASYRKVEPAMSSVHKTPVVCGTFKKAATSPTQVVQARISPEITLEASMVLKAIGFTVSEAFRLFLVKVAHDKQLPFEPLRVPNKETIRAMEESRQAKGKRYKTIESLFEGIDAE
jgi:DNA-damage-inducible protein J